MHSCGGGLRRYTQLITVHLLTKITTFNFRVEASDANDSSHPYALTLFRSPSQPSCARNDRRTLPRRVLRQTLSLHQERQRTKLRPIRNTTTRQTNRVRFRARTAAHSDLPDLHNAIFKQVRLSATALIDNRLVTDGHAVVLGDVAREQRDAGTDVRPHQTETPC